MPISQRPRWRRQSVFGLGRRRSLSSDERAIWRARLVMHRRANLLPAKQELVGRALLKRLGTDGQCDPSYHTLADDAGVSLATVGRALKTLAALGMLQWAKRLVRHGARVEQTSNAYVLSLGQAPSIPRKCAATHGDRETPQKTFILLSADDLVRAKEAQAALADIAMRRQCLFTRVIAQQDLQTNNVSLAAINLIGRTISMVGSRYIRHEPCS